MEQTLWKPAEYTHPADRANSLGAFRLWRDLGYAIAILTGIIADTFGIDASISAIGVMTIFSSGVIFRRMKCSDSSGTKTTTGLVTALSFVALFVAV